MTLGEKLLSRRFLLALLTAVWIVLTDGLGLAIPEEIYQLVVKIVSVYIAGETVTDVARSLFDRRAA